VVNVGAVLAAKGFIPPCGMLKLKAAPKAGAGAGWLEEAKGCWAGGAGPVVGGEVTEGCCGKVGGPKREGAGVAPNAGGACEPKGDLLSVAVPKVGTFAVDPKTGFCSVDAFDPNPKGDFDSVEVIAGGFVSCPNTGFASVVCTPNKDFVSVVGAPNRDFVSAGAAFVPNPPATAPKEGKAFVSAAF
jgi:hypothetical protein